MRPFSAGQRPSSTAATFAGQGVDGILVFTRGISGRITWARYPLHDGAADHRGRRRRPDGDQKLSYLLEPCTITTDGTAPGDHDHGRCADPPLSAGAGRVESSSRVIAGFPSHQARCEQGSARRPFWNRWRGAGERSANNPPRGPGRESMITPSQTMQTRFAHRARRKRPKRPAALGPCTGRRTRAPRLMVLPEGSGIPAASQQLRARGRWSWRACLAAGPTRAPLWAELTARERETRCSCAGPDRGSTTRRLLQQHHSTSSGRTGS